MDEEEVSDEALSLSSSKHFFAMFFPGFGRSGGLYLGIEREVHGWNMENAPNWYAHRDITTANACSKFIDGLQATWSHCFPQNHEFRIGKRVSECTGQCELLVLF